DVDGRRLVELLEEAGVVVTISQANVDHLRSIAPRARIRLVYNGVDLEKFAPRARPAPRDPSETVPLILFVGRMVEKNGLSHLLSAVALLRGRGGRAPPTLLRAGPLPTELPRPGG